MDQTDPRVLSLALLLGREHQKLRKSETAGQMLSHLEPALSLCISMIKVRLTECIAQCKHFTKMAMGPAGGPYSVGSSKHKNGKMQWLKIAFCRLSKGEREGLLAWIELGFGASSWG